MIIVIIYRATVILVISILLVTCNLFVNKGCRPDGNVKHQKFSHRSVIQDKKKNNLVVVVVVIEVRKML